MGWYGMVVGGVASLAGVGVTLKAEEAVEEDEVERDIKEKENRVRMYAPTQQIFDYFASYHLTKENGQSDSVLKGGDGVSP